MERRKLVYMDAKSSKFWNIELDGSSHTVNYGRTGTDGQAKTKEFDTEEKAKASFDKLVKSKLGKGYVEDAGSTPGAPGDSGGLIPSTAFVSITKLDDLYGNVKTFVGLRVADYDTEKSPNDGKTIFRIRGDWDGADFEELLEHFLESDSAENAVGLVIGLWSGDDSEMSSEPVIQKLADGAENLPNLRALYFGDVTSQENEISWIQQSDVTPLLDHFPDLEVLRVRGGNDLGFTEPKHDNLRALAIETGGLSADVVRSICTGHFPNLEHLELWLGTQEYGADCNVQDLQPILAGELFPKLKYLGLRNCEFVDDIAGVVVNSPVINKIEYLDLSLGVLSDVGAQALLSLPTGGSLKRVSIHHHFVTPAMLKKLKALDIVIDTSNPEHLTADDEWRFVAVGE